MDLSLQAVETHLGLRATTSLRTVPPCVMCSRLGLVRTMGPNPNRAVVRVRPPRAMWSDDTPAGVVSARYRSVSSSSLAPLPVTPHA